MIQHQSIRLLLAFPVLLGVVSLHTGCGKQQPSAGPPAGGGFAVPVTAVAAVQQDVPVYLDEIGKAVASQSVLIVPQVSGVIVARHFEDGADLKKGDLLFEIDPRPFQAQLDQAKGQLSKDMAQKTSAEWNVQQDQNAIQMKAISQQQLHNDIGTRDQAAGAVAVDQAQIETAQLNLNYCKITSPIDGRAGERLMDMGNVVVASGQASGTNLLSIQTLDPIYADFTVTEIELAKVQQFMTQGRLKVTVQLPQDAMATPTTMPTALPVPREGALTFLDNSVQDGSGTVKLRATLPNTDHHFWPGQFVNVRLVLTVKKDAVLVPAQAVQVSQLGPFVYVVDANGSAQPHPVMQGQRQGDMVVIESGVVAGDSVVVTGQTLLQPGGKVMVVNAPHPGAPGAPSAPGTVPPEAKKSAMNNSTNDSERKAS